MLFVLILNLNLFRVIRSRSEIDSQTEESDQQLDVPRRKRKTWEMSRQESLSSDMSRSPSPKPKTSYKVNLPRGPPVIKQPLMPNLPLDNIGLNRTRPSPSMDTSAVAEQESSDPLAEEARKHSTDMRSGSPPVPALVSKITGMKV